MDEEHKPRIEPSYGSNLYDTEVFLGHAGPFDLWYDPDFEDSNGDIEPLLTIVGPEGYMVGKRNNFDNYRITEDGNLVHADAAKDLHIGLDHMCEIYRVCMEKGLLDANAVET